MADQPSRWQHSTIQRPRKRRAGVVCTICNSRKVKCDLEVQMRHGKACSNCEKSGNQQRCEERASKRVRGTADAPSQKHDAPSSPWLPPETGLTIHQRDAAEHGRSVGMATDDPHSQLEIAENHRGLLDTGHLQMYRRETYADARDQAAMAEVKRALEPQALHNTISPDLLHTFIETYFENCYAWCPVLDRDSVVAELAKSPLLGNALALAASHVQPPILPHEGLATYYDRASRAFYNDEEPDALITLKAVQLFYWYAPRSTSLVHRHSSWWWTSIVIRQGQMLNMHREPPPKTQQSKVALRRKIWWTAAARERLTALCQSKPLLIKPEDCNIPEPTLEDFPNCGQERIKAEVFIHWIELCNILGRIAQQLSRAVSEVCPFPRQSADELISWIRCLPQHLTLQIGSKHTTRFNKEVHQLHLPYFTAIIVLHLKHSSQRGSLPKALPPAIVAASCIARIFKDILARGTTRFLMPITSWYCGISFVALASACRDPLLTDAAKVDMNIIRLTCDQLRKMWGSANVLYQGFERLEAAANVSDLEHTVSETVTTGPNELAAQESFDWIDYFPLVTRETSHITASLLSSRQNNESLDFNSFLPDAALWDLQDWFDLESTDFTFDINMR